MPLHLIVILLLALLVIAVLPSWPYSHTWGYQPFSALGLVLLVIIILALVGRF